MFSIHNTDNIDSWPYIIIRCQYNIMVDLSRNNGTFHAPKLLPFRPLSELQYIMYILYQREPSNSIQNIRVAVHMHTILTVCIT